MQVSMRALRSHNCCSRSGSEIERRSDRWLWGRSAATRRSRTMRAVDWSANCESTADKAGYLEYVKRSRRRSTRDAPAWSEDTHVQRSENSSRIDERWSESQAKADGNMWSERKKVEIPDASR
eukprot:2504322-Pleurochrysis_carterae.AAC.1